MPPQPEKSRVGKILMGALIVVSIGLIVTAVVAKHGLLTYLEMNERRKSMQADLSNIQKENEQLKKEIGALKSDPDTIEKIAREELGMVKPGEVLYRIEKKEKVEPPNTGENKP